MEIEEFNFAKDIKKNEFYIQLTIKSGNLRRFRIYLKESEFKNFFEKLSYIDDLFEEFIISNKA